MTKTVKAKDLTIGTHVINIGHVSKIEGTIVWFDNGKVRNFSPEKEIVIRVC